MAAKESRKRSRFTLQFEDSDERLVLLREKISNSKTLLGVANNYLWLEKLISFYETHRTHPSNDDETDMDEEMSLPVKKPLEIIHPALAPPSSSSDQQSKVEIHTALDDDDGEYFIACKATIRSLVKGLTESKGCCSICGGFLLLDSCQMERRGHCGRISIACENNHEIVWFSSPISKSKYVANLRLVHGFMSSGLTETQYRSFTQAASLGSVEHTYLDTVFNKLGYFAAIQSVYEDNIHSAMRQTQEEQAYIDNDGDIVITDARHDSSRNAQHTTVTAMSYYNKKILMTVNWSKTNLPSAASREIPMTKLLFEILEEHGHEIAEICHDNVSALQNWAVKEKRILNSYDTWHGGKNMKKLMKQITTGTKKTEGVTWFSELSDKAKATKTHCYYTMKEFSSSNKTAEEFRSALLNVIEHYQGKHTKCPKESRCQMADYVCSKKPLVNPKAIAAYRKAITDSLIYRNPEDYMRCRDTYWIESFHSTLLIYTPKRINFGDETYATRIQLAVLDWNENVNRDVFSVKNYQYARNPDRKAPTRVRKPKTFNFRSSIWNTFFSACL